jgi:hypothetical protein
MKEQLAPGEVSDRRKICVVHGLGGIGKTQLATEYESPGLAHHEAIKTDNPPAASNETKDVVSILNSGFFWFYLMDAFV